MCLTTAQLIIAGVLIFFAGFASLLVAVWVYVTLDSRRYAFPAREKTSSDGYR